MCILSTFEQVRFGVHPRAIYQGCEYLSQGNYDINILPLLYLIHCEMRFYGTLLVMLADTSGT